MKNIRKINLVLFVVFSCFFAILGKNSAADQLSTSKFVAASIQKTDSGFKTIGLRIANGEYVYSNSIYQEEPDGRVVSFQGKNLGYFPVGSLKTIICSDEFNEKTGEIKGGCEEVSKGSLLINIPYFPNGKFADIYDEKGNKVFSIDLSSVATCNENAKCDQGENRENCPTDCNIKDALSKFKVVENNPESTVANKSEKSNIWYLLAAAFALIFALAFYFIWRKRQK